MNIIKNFDSIEEINSVIYNPFTVSRVDVLTIDSKIAYVIQNDLFTNLRKSIKNNIPLSDLIAFNDEVLNSESIQYLVQAYAEKQIYPFSRKEFYSTFLSNVVPSLADVLYDHMKLTNRIKPIGSGQHKGYIITPIEYTDNETIATPIRPDAKQLCENIIDSVQALATYITEASFYEDKIAQRDEFINSLYEEITNLHSQINSAYQTTWR
jgi:hypothetical protein